MTRNIIKIFIVLVIIFGGYLIAQGTYKSAPLVSDTSNQEQKVEEHPTEKLTSQPLPLVQQPVLELSVKQAPPVEKKEYVINYTDEGFSPATLQIKKNETVTFKNKSSSSMWPASAMHPTHQVYPTTGGCLGSTFDACKGVQPGDSWSFKFEVVGSWKYHDHLTPQDRGTINVE